MKKKSNHLNLERLSVLLPKTEIRRVKHFAVDQEISASEVLRRAIRTFLPGKTCPPPNESDSAAA